MDDNREISLSMYSVPFATILLAVEIYNPAASEWTVSNVDANSVIAVMNASSNAVAEVMNSSRAETLPAVGNRLPSRARDVPVTWQTVVRENIIKMEIRLEIENKN